MLTPGFGKFSFITPEDQIHRSKARLTDAARPLLNPTNSNPLEQGEWISRNSGDTSRWERNAADGPALAAPVLQPKGSTDCQALGVCEIPGHAEGAQAWTTTYDPDGTYAAGTRLKAFSLSVDPGDGARTMSVLSDCDADLDNVVAVVEQAPETPSEFTAMLIRIATFTHGQA